MEIDQTQQDNLIADVKDKENMLAAARSNLEQLVAQQAQQLAPMQADVTNAHGAYVASANALISFLSAQ